MAKVPRLFYAVVRMTIVRQVDFEVEFDTTDEEIKRRVIEKARREYGSTDEIEIVEMESR